jgi:hypothetical protein
MNKKMNHIKPKTLESKKYRTVDYSIVLDTFGYSVIAFRSVCIEVCGTFQTYEEAKELFNNIGKKVKKND